MAVKDQIQKLVAPLVTDLGYEFVGLEYRANPKHCLLRVYIDKEPGDKEQNGVGLDDCAQVSREISALLDVEDPIKGGYSLEVSSPGLERPLFNADQFNRFAGHQAKVSLLAPLDGRRKLLGVIASATDQALILREAGGEITVEMDNISKAHLVPDYDALLKH